MSDSIFRYLFDWRHLVENPTTVEDAEKAVDRGSIPAFSFYFMLAISAVIATLGLLANSAAVIIGAMIIAPPCEMDDGTFKKPVDRRPPGP